PEVRVVLAAQRPRRASRGGGAGSQGTRLLLVQLRPRLSVVRALLSERKAGACARRDLTVVFLRAGGARAGRALLAGSEDPAVLARSRGARTLEPPSRGARGPPDRPGSQLRDGLEEQSDVCGA